VTDEQFRILYKKWRSVEEYHKSLKQNVSIEQSPAHTELTQSMVTKQILRFFRLKYGFWTLQNCVFVAEVIE
jgi:hypothetical protein